MFPEDKVVIEHFRQVDALIKKRQLADAMAKLYDIRRWCPVSAVLTFERLDRQREVYKQMLGYVTQCVDDPQQETIYEHIIAELYAIADDLKQSILANSSKALPYTKMRSKSLDETILLTKNICELQGEEYEQCERNYFDGIWLSKSWNSDCSKALIALVVSPEVKNRTKCLLISALTLSILRHFKPEKIETLLSFANLSIVVVRQRAIVGLALALATCPERTALDHQALVRLHLLLEDKTFCKELLTAYLQLVRTFETEAITQRIREDIMPSMMRVNRDIQSKRNVEEELDEDDWQEAFDEAGLNDKLQEMSEMQFEGSDVYMATFAQLKDDSFFDEPANWLMPFDAELGVVSSSIGDLHRLLNSLSQMPFICDSDKYSLCLTMGKMPESSRSMLENGVSAESEQMQEVMKDENLLHSDKFATLLSNQYVQDLYRFYIVHPHKADFENPLPAVLNFYKSPIFELVFPDVETRVQIASFYLKQKHYFEAAAQLESLIPHLEDTSQALAQLGYCYQKMFDYESAARAYEKSDLQSPNNYNTLRHLAFCWSRLGQYQKALDAYEMCDKLKPNNFKLLLLKGHCLVEMGSYKQALETYFCADNLQPDDVTCIRAIAWCYLLDKQLDKSIKYYQKIIAVDAQNNDYINLGHAYLVAQNRKSAIDCYSKAYQMSENKEQFYETLRFDWPDLLPLGVSENDLDTYIEYFKLC